MLRNACVWLLYLGQVAGTFSFPLLGSLHKHGVTHQAFVSVHVSFQMQNPPPAEPFDSPGSGKVGPVGHHVGRQVPVSVPVSRRSAEGFAKDVLQVIGVVGTHPVMVGFPRSGHQTGLRHHVGEGASGPATEQAQVSLEVAFPNGPLKSRSQRTTWRWQHGGRWQSE